MIRSTSKRGKRKASGRSTAGSLSQTNSGSVYGLGLDVVVVVLVELDELGGVEVVVVFVLDELLLDLSVLDGGFTTVVLFSVFFSGAGEVVVVGATTVLSSHAARSAALAKMQINFFIVRIGCPSWTKLIRNALRIRPCRTATLAGRFGLFLMLMILIMILLLPERS